jgi:hypothetical protein
MDDKLKPNQEKRIIENCVESIMDDLDVYYFDKKLFQQYEKQLTEFFTKISEEHSLFSPRFDLSNKKNIVNDKEKIKKAATFTDSFLVRTNTNLKKYTASKDLPEKESVIEILESQKRVLEKIKEILT